MAASRKHRPVINSVRSEVEALRTELNQTFEALWSDLKALNVKLNLLLVINISLLPTVLALLWKTFFATP